METINTDEPVTPAGRLFLQAEMNQIINCAIGVKNTLDIDAVKSEITTSIMLKQPRFSSLLIIDSHGREHWRRTQVNVDRHVIVRDEPVTNGDPSISQEDAVNDYIADLAVSSPLSTDKPLWEVHLLMAHNCLVVRLHHALGDGISLMSMFLTICRKADDPSQMPTIGGVGTSLASSGGQRRKWRTALWRALLVVWYTLVFVVEFLLRSLWLKDSRTAVSGGAGVELWPRKLATAKFRLDDMKVVKRAVAEATINDVLFGVVSCGLSRYLDIRSPNALQDGIQMTGLSMVNLRPQPGLQDFSKLLDSKSGTRFGNQFGMLLLPVYYHKGGSDPLQFVRRAKAMIDKKKLSLEALFSYKIGYFVMSCFGAKLAGLLNYRIVCNTTFTISNVVGPREEITIIGNPVTYLRANTSSLPHAVTVHMVSYAGRADLQILVAKDIIPDPQLLARCFEDALLEMKEYAEAANTTRKEK
ncbi:O-acyltransferase WSD1-like [Coffea eugenioides]|uniref:Wax ester synthase/diacylglycerol acyltransferase 11-like n=1 Tax=Coffea arabica TaxID=13443 RepID=A0A6P6WBC5_COFAR|nr:O-acyltransferase WSD1-like [Coffea arabica]XP_027164024.1 O-acyltransferase WSD1-like [Coffea eugenioides]